MCKGGGECQFKDLRAAKSFCKEMGTCAIIIDHNGPNDCALGLGCFTPRLGAGLAQTSIDREIYICQSKILNTYGGSR